MTPERAAIRWKVIHTAGARAGYTDLVRGCHALGADVEYSGAMTMTCGLVVRAENEEGVLRTVVKIGRDSPRRRRLFTLAHELGHLVYERLGLDVDDEERWCNRFAAELVHYRPQASETVSQDIGSLLAYAREHDMGVVPTFVALRRERRWRCGLLLIQRVESAAVLARAYGVESLVRDHLRLGEGFACSHVSRVPGQHTFKLRLGQEPISVVAESAAQGETIFVLLTEAQCRNLAREGRRRAQRAWDDLALGQARHP